MTFEVNFDGLIGPTHNYSGLSFGNVASASNAGAVSNPRAAALQGLAKMKYLADLGLPQAILPPQMRPDFALLHQLGFTGNEAQVIAKVAKEAPVLLHHAYSASSMWAANAATVSPSADTEDGKVHFTPANLVSTLHRSREAAQTARALRRIFADERHFTHHDPLPAQAHFADEGAANHTRLCAAHAVAGVELFVYGRRDGETGAPQRFPARQSYAASAAVARLHGLSAARCVFARQHPEAIDAGVFHNDVIAVGHENVLLYHELALAEEEAVIAELQTKMGGALLPLRIGTAELSLEDAVSTYFFNSQLVTLPGGGMAVIAPKECEEHRGAAALFARLVDDRANPISAVHFLDVRESMRNGGGPACLRLRVALTDAEWAAVQQGVKFTDSLYARLTAWVEKHYRDRLAPQDLADPALARESAEALASLSEIILLPCAQPSPQN